MQIRDLMTRDVQTVGPADSIRRAAEMMDSLNVGSLPVCDGGRVVGMVTDRDITVRATSAGRAPDDCKVDEVMTTDVHCCYEDDVVTDVARLMGNVQIRRVPVLDADDRLVGIVALGDIATEAKENAGGPTLERVSTPSRPDRG